MKINLVIFLWMTASICQSVELDLLKQSIVEINNQKVERDFVYPWQLWQNSSSSGSGVIISGNKILTAAHVIDYAEEISLRKPGSDQLYEGKVLYVSDGSDLAIIVPEDLSFFDGTIPVKLGELPGLGDEITTLGFPSGGTQLALTKGIVSRIDFDEYSHSESNNLVIQIDAAVNPGASGGGAFIDGDLAGVPFQGFSGSSVENVGYIVPTPVIQQFLEDIKDGKVDGVPALGISVQSMHNEQLRDFYKMPDNSTGLLVLGSVMDSLESDTAIIKDDVILKIDGELIGNDGTVSFISGDRINLGALVKFKQIGEVINVEVLRDGKQKSFPIQLQHQNVDTGPVISHTVGFLPDYEIVGGMIFQELSNDYIDFSFDRDDVPAWMQIAQDELHKSSNKRRYVFVSGILPDQINRSYDIFEDEPVVRVNGEDIDSLATLRNLIENNQENFHVIEFSGHEKKVVFDKDALTLSNETIKQRYEF